MVPSRCLPWKDRLMLVPVSKKGILMVAEGIMV